MSKDTTEQSVLFEHEVDRRVVATFDQENSSSDGGLILLKAADTRLNLSQAIADSIRDDRDPCKVRHGMEELVRQRMFALACGYEDCNDAARLSNDPVHRVMTDKGIENRLASQPTLSRLENTMDGRSLLKMALSMMDSVINRHRKRLSNYRLITLDMDPTDIPLYGQQQLSLFNGHYGGYCYLPTLAFIQFDDETDQYLLASALRCGDARASEGSITMLKRILPRLKKAFPNSRIRVRLDGGYSCSDLFDFLDETGVEYVVGYTENAVLKALSEPAMKKIRRLSARSNKSERTYGQTEYSAASWSETRQVIYKAEVTVNEYREPRDNARYVVSNIRRSPKFIYENIYRKRGDVENRLKELIHGLNIDRCSCRSFLANQFRILITSAAYMLYQEIRLMAKGTALEGAQVTRLRESLIKLGVWVNKSVRRYVFHLPSNAPWRYEWLVIAKKLNAVPPP